MRLLDEVKKLLNPDARLAKDVRGAPADLEVQAATALLLLEAAYGDEEYLWCEHRAIVNGLKDAFGIGKAEVRELLERSEEIRSPRVSLADVTEVLVDRYDAMQRLEVLRLVWRVVAADGTVEDWEDVFATHIAKTLGISDEQAAAARREAKPSA